MFFSFFAAVDRPSFLIPTARGWGGGCLLPFYPDPGVNITRNIIIVIHFYFFLFLYHTSLPGRFFFFSFFFFRFRFRFGSLFFFVLIFFSLYFFALFVLFASSRCCLVCRVLCIVCILAWCPHFSPHLFLFC